MKIKNCSGALLIDYEKSDSDNQSNCKVALKVVIITNERVKELRKDLGLTQDKFGKKLGVTKTAISSIEHGINGVTDQMFKSICREFNICEEWLRNGTGPMHPEIDEDVEYGQICAELGVTDPMLKRFILNYGKLPEEDRKSFWSFINILVKSENDNS